MPRLPHLLGVPLTLAVFVTIAPVVPATAMTRPARVATESFDRYWVRFRQAVVTHDMRRLASLASFPVRGKGELDDDPVVRITPANFAREFNRALARGGDGDVGGPTMMTIVRQKTHLATSDLDGGDNQRVGAFEFNRKAGRWALVQIYRGSEE